MCALALVQRTLEDASQAFADPRARQAAVKAAGVLASPSEEFPAILAEESQCFQDKP